MDIGKWWGTDKVKRKEVDIDIMGKIDNDKLLFCECKWHNELIPLSVYDELLEKSKLFNCKQKLYYIFSKKGFTVALKSEAKQNKNTHLVAYKDMFR